MTNVINFQNIER